MVGHELAGARLAVARGAAAAAHFLAHARDRLVGHVARTCGRRRLAPRREHGHGPAGGGGQRAHHLVEPTSSSTSRSRRLWIAMPRCSISYCSFTSCVERLLGERDEGQLRRAPRTPGSPARRPLRPAGRAAPRNRSRAEAQPGQMASRQQAHELALALLGVELDSGGEQQLPAREPWRRVGELRDVDPANRRVRGTLACDELEARLGDQAAYGQHSLSAGRSGPRPR